MDETKEELIFARQIEELAKSAYYKTIACYSDFLNLNEQSIFHRMKKELPPVAYSLYGGCDDAERRILCFHGDYDGSGELNGSDFKEAYPIACLEISPSNSRFAESLSHRDYLGAILNLGIDRSKTGDILISGDTAYLYCDPFIADFIAEQLDRIRHTSVKVSHRQTGQEIERNYEMIHANVPSLRLDAVIGAAFHSSRSSMTGLIPGGKVFVNGREILQGSYQIKPGEIVSVRGYGKFRFEEQGTLTKKGRINITIRKYT